MYQIPHAVYDWLEGHNNLSKQKKWLQQAVNGMDLLSVFERFNNTRGLLKEN